MKVALIGRTQWLYETGRYLHANGIEIPLVITASPAPEYSRKISDFERFAREIGAGFYVAKHLYNKALVLKLEQCDVGVSVNWPFVISQESIEHFRGGILNAHMGDLPRYRGNACPNWAIINGEKEIAISIHVMEGRYLDCGRVITQKKITLNDNTYITDIYNRANSVIPSLFLEALSLLSKNPYYMLKYADSDSPDSLRCYPRKPEDSRISWSDTAENIHRLIRASSRPFLGAYGFFEGKRIIVWKSELFFDHEHYCAVPGQVCAVNPEYFVVITGKGKLKITEWECEEQVLSIRQRLE